MIYIGQKVVDCRARKETLTCSPKTRPAIIMESPRMKSEEVQPTKRSQYTSRADDRSRQADGGWAAQALRMFALHVQEAGLFRSSERMFRASNRQLKTITASGLRRELRQTLILRRLSVRERD